MAGDTEKKIKRSISIYPIYEGLSGDLIFYGMVETLFLSLAKGFSVEEIALIFFIASVGDPALELPSLFIVCKIGNNKATALGSLLPLLAIVIITFSNSIPIMSIGQLLFAASLDFQHMSSISINNNLKLTSMQDGFIKLSSRANVIYSVVSMAASVAATFLFNINYYLPSACCMVVCLAAFILSFFVHDYSHESMRMGEASRKRDAKIRLNTTMVLLAISSACSSRFSMSGN